MTDAGFDEVTRDRLSQGQLHPHKQNFNKGRKYTKQIAKTQIPVTIKVGTALKIK